MPTVVDPLPADPIRRTADLKDLADEQRELHKAGLEYMGTYGKQTYAGWQGKELLRDLLGLAVTRSHVTPDHSCAG
ncbi:hypothetical protein ACFYW6_36570 [Streptomyces sp. NPDC002659]|uniref:hypothetical protein n=1 Tax=Streptomyces sp. NPDC002659 TaxID=3364656 RepID=UPI0036737860